MGWIEGIDKKKWNRKVVGTGDWTGTKARGMVKKKFAFSYYNKREKISGPP